MNTYSNMHNYLDYKLFRRNDKMIEPSVTIQSSHSACVKMIDIIV